MDPHLKKTAANPSTRPSNSFGEGTAAAAWPRRCVCGRMRARSRVDVLGSSATTPPSSAQPEGDAAACLASAGIGNSISYSSTRGSNAGNDVVVVGEEVCNEWLADIHI